MNRSAHAQMRRRLQWRCTRGQRADAAAVQPAVGRGELMCESICACVCVCAHVRMCVCVYVCECVYMCDLACAFVSASRSPSFPPFLPSPPSLSLTLTPRCNTNGQKSLMTGRRCVRCRGMGRGGRAAAQTAAHQRSQPALQAHDTWRADNTITHTHKTDAYTLECRWKRPHADMLAVQ